ncbi:lipase family alpha/beta hydrolase [uncultured Jatrophihabitans sp.]|uniref:lipase family alpha/beta hydrolase n=1 Tax=uncultured Jatrophihabitans sp. TaxID=1610747 RepID=UPI0035C9754E
MLGSLSPARRNAVLATIVLLVAAVVAVIVVVVHSSESTAPSPRAADQDALGPVLLLPGYGGSTRGLDDLAAVLRRHGRDATVVHLPGNAQGDLNAQARAVTGAAAAALRRTGRRTVDVVGYSAGGVLARLWVRNYGGAARTRRVVTLGSPQHGTSIAALAGSLLPGACPTACRQLAPDSTLLRALNSGDETPAGPTWVSVWTTHDDVVLPPSSASLVGALDLTVQSVCPRDTVTHSGLPTDRDVQAIVAAELAAGAPARPRTCTSA